MRALVLLVSTLGAMLGLVPSSAADVVTVPEGTDFTAHDIGIAEYNRDQWVRLRRGDSIGLGAPGEVELLDFWMIVGLRCVMTQVSFGLNGAPAVSPLALEPCHDDLSSRDTLLDQVAFPPVFQAPTGSIPGVQSLELRSGHSTTEPSRPPKEQLPHIPSQLPLEGQTLERSRRYPGCHQARRLTAIHVSDSLLAGKLRSFVEEWRPWYKLAEAEFCVRTLRPGHSQPRPRQEVGRDLDYGPAPHWNRARPGS